MNGNPHLGQLRALAIVGILLGVIVTLIGVMTYQAAALAPVGIALLSLGILAYLLKVAAAAITWKPGEK